MSGENDNQPKDPFEGFVSDAAEDGAPVVKDDKGGKDADAPPADKNAEGGDEGGEADDESDKADGDGEAEEDDEAAKAAAAAAKKAEEDDDEDPEDKTLGEKVRKRIGALTAKRRAAEREADELRGRLKALEEARDEPKKTAPLTPTKDDTTSPPKPDPKDAKYKFGELDAAYITDLAEWSAQNAFTKARKDADAKETEKRSREAADAAASEFAQKRTAVYEAGAKLHEDFNEVVVEGAEKGTWKLSKDMAELALGSEVGAEILYHLASNPKIARELFSKSPLEQAAAFGRLEAKFEKPKEETPPANRIPKAPTPLKDTAKGGGGKTTVRADTPDFAAFERMVQAKGK